MITVLLVIHLILAVSIIGLVLLQRSEGGGLGLSSGGGLGSFATPQATASAMNKVTWVCAACFFTTSLLLGVLYNHASSKRSILDHLDRPVAAISVPVEDIRAVDDAPVVPDTAPPATPDKPKQPAKATSKTKTTKKSEPTVPITP